MLVWAVELPRSDGEDLSLSHLTRPTRQSEAECLANLVGERMASVIGHFDKLVGDFLSSITFKRVVNRVAGTRWAVLGSMFMVSCSPEGKEPGPSWASSAPRMAAEQGRELLEQDPRPSWRLPVVLCCGTQSFPYPRAVVSALRFRQDSLVRRWFVETHVDGEETSAKMYPQKRHYRAASRTCSAQSAHVLKSVACCAAVGGAVRRSVTQHFDSGAGRTRTCDRRIMSPLL
jgi:hypothetical protein